MEINMQNKIGSNYELNRLDFSPQELIPFIGLEITRKSQSRTLQMKEVTIEELYCTVCTGFSQFPNWKSIRRKVFPYITKEIFISKSRPSIYDE